MIAILNPAAGGGRARRRWARVVGELRARRPGLAIVAGNGGPRGVREAIRGAVAAGETEFVAAGGDGTVNFVASALAELAPEGLPRLALGAVGLGSSNDFHKPRVSGSFVAGVPTRLDFAHAAPRDVCAVRVVDEQGTARTLYFIVNASIGITAEANWRFNHPDRWLAALKRVSTGTAITWAALRTLLAACPVEGWIRSEGLPAERVRLKNLGVVKCPNFAGGLRYDSAFEPESGRLCVHLVRAMGVVPLLRVFASLWRGRFTGLPGTESWQAGRLAVAAERPFAVECDGEVARGVRAEFFVLPHRLKVCPP
jgi:diacylglycerol kinase family enzyme